MVSPFISSLRRSFGFTDRSSPRHFHQEEIYICIPTCSLSTSGPPTNVPHLLIHQSIFTRPPFRSMRQAYRAIASRSTTSARMGFTRV